jgi:hypothetical protein
MKSGTSLLLGLLSMMGCSIGKPPAGEVAAIEAATTQDACVGSLARWHRIFAYQRFDNRINRNIITISYVEAGHRGLPAGRVIAEPDWRTLIDDSQHRYAYGEYDRKHRRFTDWSCGCNFEVRNEQGQVECPADKD